MDAPEAHVRNVMVREVVSIHRQRRHRAELLRDRLSDAPLSRQDDGAVEPELLWLLVSALPQRQRVALVLLSYEALTESQTAEVLGWSLRRVRRQFDDAQLALRRALTEARPAEEMDG